MAKAHRLANEAVRMKSASKGIPVPDLLFPALLLGEAYPVPIGYRDFAPVHVLADSDWWGKLSCFDHIFDGSRRHGKLRTKFCFAQKLGE